MGRKIGVFTAVLLAIAFMFTVDDARATPVHIVNAGFEDPAFPNPDDEYYREGAPTGWTQIGWDSSVVGTWRVTYDDFTPVVAPEGQNVAYTKTQRGGTSWVGLQQILDTPFAGGKNYTLNVEVGNSWHYWFSGYRIQLLAGDTVIAEDNNTLHPDWYEWATSTVEYTYDPLNFDDSLVGELLGIQLINLGRNPDRERDPDKVGASYYDNVGVEFDNVRLENDDVVPTPEPATMLLLGAGLLGLAGVGRKKLFRK